MKYALLTIGVLVIAVLSALVMLVETSETRCVEGYVVRHTPSGNNLVRGADGHAVPCAKEKT